MKKSPPAKSGTWVEKIGEEWSVGNPSSHTGDFGSIQDTRAAGYRVIDPVIRFILTE